MQSSSDARPKRSGMTRVFPDGHVILKGGIEESFTNGALSRVPIITGTNKDENKFFNSMNRDFVKWGPSSGLYSTVGIDEMPLEIIDLDYYEAINFYGSSFWKQRAVDSPAKQLVESGHSETFAYRFDWDELSTVNGMDLSKLIGAAHALEILFVFGSFDSYIVKNFLFGEDAYPAGKKLSDQIQSYWAEFAYNGNPGKGRDNSLPLWSSWSIGDGNKYLVLDSENDQGVVMSDIEYTKDYLLDRLSKDERFDDQERCEALFGLSYGDGNGISLEEFNLFMDGLCTGRDYSAIIDMIESTEEEILENQDT
jgi:para-nitrobenzyl esterase